MKKEKTTWDSLWFPTALAMAWVVVIYAVLGFEGGGWIVLRICPNGAF
jgi:hypothetical protein